MVYGSWMITCTLCIASITIFADELSTEKRETKSQENIDEIQNDILFSFHAQRELKRNIKRKRDAASELHKIQHEDIHGNPFYKSILEWSKNDLRSSEHADSEIDLINTDRGRPVKREVSESPTNSILTSYVGERNLEESTIAVCNMEQLMTYLAELQAINPESIINLATQQDVDSLCDRAINSLDNIDTYLQSCTPPSEKDMYLQLIEGVRSLSNKVCFDRIFRTDFMKHAPCITLLHNDYKDCVGPSDWVEDPNTTVICKTYKDIANCYYLKTSTGCGDESAGIMKALLKHIMNRIVQVDCGYLFGTDELSAVSPLTVPQSQTTRSPRYLPGKKEKNEKETKEVKRQDTMNMGVKGRIFGPLCYVLLSVFCYNL